MFLRCEKIKFENTGVITGADMAMCACCGGYFIDIDGISYRFEKSELPVNFTFKDPELPLKVKLNWELKSEICKGSNWIKISDIRKV
jgi:hypothetical protein